VTLLRGRAAGFLVLSCKGDAPPVVVSSAKTAAQFFHDRRASERDSRADFEQQILMICSSCFADFVFAQSLPFFQLVAL